MIDPRWFAAAFAAGAALLALWGRTARSSRRGGAGPLPLFELPALGASLCGGALAGFAAAQCFGVYPAEMLLGAAVSGAVPTALAAAYLLS